MTTNKISKESLLTIVEILSTIQIGSVFAPEFDTRLQKLQKLKSEVLKALEEYEQNRNNSVG